MEAIILCGGNGRRLAPLTNNIPKGMIEVNGLPLLCHQVKWLKEYNVTNIIFACGYKAQVIRNYFGDDYKYSIEETPLGRGGALRKAWQSEESVIVLNGDILTKLDLAQMIDRHKWHRGMATLALFKYQSPYGIAKIQKSTNRIVYFKEKELLNEWISGGVYIFNKEVKQFLPEVGDHEMNVFPHLAKNNLLYGYKSEAYWKPIDTMKDLESCQ